MRTLRSSTILVSTTMQLALVCQIKRHMSSTVLALGAVTGKNEDANQLGAIVDLTMLN